ncbi:class I SAM-dependent methyltransferase [Methylophilus sp. 3sh_L]|uniref:class I SAM-dependent methyltransferase n=1 Tax=Methylophilus sp. 3sh_L TaxID=3377114 RepID=UPI00398F6BFD
MIKENLVCPICNTAATLLDVVDLNKSCEEQRGKFLPLSGDAVYYSLCNHCGFCWAPELHQWPLSQFEEYIYNADYGAVDPDYLETRPQSNAEVLRSIFPVFPPTLRHLDYGGGNGLLSRQLSAAGWHSASYDPFVDKHTDLASLGQFELITAFEVFEHVPDVWALMSDLSSLLARDGLVLFSTLLSDGNIHPNQRLSWWYASPRNGHISLFSKSSLALLAQRNQFNFGSFNSGFHALYTTVPPWASHLIRVG